MTSLLFDENLSLQLWNQAFAAVLEFPPQALFRGARFEDLLALMAERGSRRSVVGVGVTATLTPVERR